MGTGVHGGFGNTRGSHERYRIGRPVPPTEIDFAMALNKRYYVDTIIRKYNIHLKSGKNDIKVEIDHSIVQAGKVEKARPNVIVLGPEAFRSETELANTIAHELNHARSYLKGGIAPEDPAYSSGNALDDYIRGKR